MIMTVRGKIKPQELGIVAMCEYILYGLPGWENDPWVDFDRPDVFASIKSLLLEFKSAGGDSLVDCSGTLLGRDAEFLLNISAETGIKIIASCGLCNQEGIPGHFFPAMKVPDANNIAEMLYHEISKGMPVTGLRRTEIKAGVIRADSSWDHVTQIEELSLRCAAAAAKRAGVSLIITGTVKQARRQLEMLLEEGLEPDRIIIGHCDDGRAIDLERDKEMAQKGVYIAYDHVGWEDSFIPYAIPDEHRVTLVKTMIDAGFTDRIVLSCSAIGYAIGAPQPKHSFSHLLKNFVPKLKAAGISQSTIDAILIENPKRILTSKTSQNLQE